jgi:elongation factor P--beta-lysine ligase
VAAGRQLSNRIPGVEKSLLARRNRSRQIRIEALVPQAQRALQTCKVFRLGKHGNLLMIHFTSIPVFHFVPDYQMLLTDAVKLMLSFLAFLKKKPFHPTEGGKGFRVFDLSVVRLISVPLTLTSTAQFYFINPLSSMILTWYMHHHFLSRTSSRDLSISDLLANTQGATLAPTEHTIA